MASVPLMSDQDVELGSPPSYENVVNGKTSDDKDANKAKFNASRLFAKSLDDATDATSVAFAHVSIRLNFLRKILGILAFQFVITFVFCGALYLTPNVRLFVQKQAWIVIGSAFGSIFVLFAMFVHAYTVPLNYFLLAAWTVLQAITIGAITTFYEAEVVIQAILLTAIVVVSLFVYTLQSKRDFRKHYAMLFTLSMIFLVATLIQIFLMSSMFNFMVSMFGAMLFSMYLVFDIDMIMHHYSEEDYIIACISIYMDIMGLFLRILEILNEVNRS